LFLGITYPKILLDFLRINFAVVNAQFFKVLELSVLFPFLDILAKIIHQTAEFRLYFLDYVIFVIVIIIKKRKRILYPYSNFCARMVGGIAHPRFINNPATNYLSL